METLGFFRLGSPENTVGTVQKKPGFQRFPFLRGILVMAFDLKATEEVTATAVFLNKKGNPAPIDGDVSWITSNSELLALTPAGPSCKFAAIGPIGTVTVSALADADLGEGVKTVRLDTETNIVAGEASVGSITFGAPTEQP